MRDRRQKRNVKRMNRMIIRIKLHIWQKMIFVNQHGHGRVWAVNVDADATPNTLSARMTCLNPSGNGFQRHAARSAQMSASFGGKLLAAAYVDDQCVGLNNLIIVTRPSAVSVAISRVDLNGDDAVVDSQITHTLPPSWSGASVVVEIMDGPHVWFSCPSQAESQLVLIRNDDLHMLYASVPQPHMFQSACLIANSTVDPASRTSATPLDDMHLLVHSTDGDTHVWHTLPLPPLPPCHHPRHFSARSQPSKPHVPPRPKRYLPSNLPICCVWTDQEEVTSSTHRILLGTTAPSLVATVHDCIVATLTLHATPIDIQYADVHGLDGGDASGVHDGAVAAALHRADIFVVTCLDHSVVVVMSLQSTLSIVQEFTNVHRVFVNDFKRNGWDQILLVPSNDVDEHEWVLTDVMSVVPSATGDAGPPRRSKQSKRKTAHHVDHASIQMLLNKLAAPAQADKLDAIQAALAIRAKEADASLLAQQSMLDEKRAVLAMLERQCRHVWLDQTNSHTVPGEPSIDDAAAAASRTPLQPLVPPLDNIDNAPSGFHAVPILVHPLLLESIAPTSIQHSPLFSTLHFVVTVRNASSAPLEQVTALLVGSKVASPIHGGSDVVRILAPHSTHAFHCHIALPSDVHRRSHVDWHVLAAWGHDNCLVFDQDPVRVAVYDMLHLPVHAPNLDTCDLLLLSTTCQLDQWLVPSRANELGVTIDSIKAGVAKVTVAAPNAAILECQLRHLQRQLGRHNIFVLENPLHPAHLHLLDTALSSMQAELAFEAAQPAPDRRGIVQMELDRAIGQLHAAMKRRAFRRQPPSSPSSPSS
ncbi:hypothetical protein H310_03632 [Aphanomyces invadans]|uniref:Uncharacterized protein n=1 Tax=Aphanomyces invadans TaxID=157072 RepID=A0A024UK94_9STRA|nr:hypothetical protein H310_03632 [Aphanomyces invadans]ETW06023.1 hypothetical protein H310_03632 [Aphanomyces invadans]|eukprot:XP_008865800.1 hypothetical protein H310_03632 [Aphanomyces invadans]